MKKSIIITVLMLVCALLLPSCKDDEPAATENVHRTILVYMVACNSLGSSGYDILDLDEMQAAVNAGDLAGGRLLVFLAPNDGSSTLYEITPQGKNVLKTYDTGDGLTPVHATRMSQVIDDAKKYAPADSYGLVLWSHGLGWLQNGISDDYEPAISPQSWGEDRGRTMNITSLRNALTGKGMDFIYFDCCYMASVEVAYELRHVTPYIVASAIELPSEGMPYDRNIAPLFKSGHADLVSAARNTFDFYNSRTAEERTCAISVIATAGLDRLALAARDIYRASSGQTPTAYQPQRFMTESRCWFFDLADYYDALSQNSDDGATLKAAFDNALEDCVLYAASTPKLWDHLDISHHCGLSTYILPDPDDPTIRNYNSLAWYSDVIAR